MKGGQKKTRGFIIYLNVDLYRTNQVARCIKAPTPMDTGGAGDVTIP